MFIYTLFRPSLQVVGGRVPFFGRDAETNFWEWDLAQDGPDATQTITDEIATAKLWFDYEKMIYSFRYMTGIVCWDIIPSAYVYVVVPGLVFQSSEYWSPLYYVIKMTAIVIAIIYIVHQCIIYCEICTRHNKSMSVGNILEQQYV